MKFEIVGRQESLGHNKLNSIKLQLFMRLFSVGVNYFLIDPEAHLFVLDVSWNGVIIEFDVTNLKVGSQKVSPLSFLLNVLCECELGLHEGKNKLEFGVRTEVSWQS